VEERCHERGYHQLVVFLFELLVLLVLLVLVYVDVSVYHDDAPDNDHDRSASDEQHRATVIIVVLVDDEYHDLALAPSVPTPSPLARDYLPKRRDSRSSIGVAVLVRLSS
jgi:hypothetical protein